MIEVSYPYEMAPKINKCETDILKAFSTKKDIIIQAGAGCGKTTMIIKLIQQIKNSKILYLVFNKKNQEEAKEKIKSENGNTIEIATSNSFCGKVVCG